MESSSSDEENNVCHFNHESDDEENIEDSDVCSDDCLVNETKDKESGCRGNSIKDNGEESSSDFNMKFLSSQFFDKFVCQPVTSKVNDVKDMKNLNQPSSGNPIPGSSKNNVLESDVDIGTIGCKLRKNVDQQEDKTKDDSKCTNSKTQAENIPFPNFGTYIPPFQFVQPVKKTYNSSDEYFADLRLWLQQAFFWQSVTAAFPYFLMCQQFGQAANSNSSSNQQAPAPFNFPPQFPFPFPPFQGLVQHANLPTGPLLQNQQAAQRQQITDGVECRIPSFWKRIAAEFIDFMILFFVKIAVTYIAIDFFHLVDLDQLDILHKDSKVAYKQFMQITQEIVILELIHRLVVCAFETFWLRSGHNGQIGGATPGKSIMGLRVILCESSIFVRESEGVVIVRPGTNLGLPTAFFRSVTKNFVLALLVPTSFAFIFFPHNRTGYDMICSTIVVEEPVIPNRRNE